MQQFQVPQFIDIEDRLIGQLTIKQFVYIIAGIGAIVILRLIGLPAVLFWPSAVFVAAFFAALAFLKINGQPFVVILNNALNHVSNPRLYIWKRREQETKKQKNTTPTTPAHQAPRLSKSKLKDLAWSLDINDQLKR